MGIEQVKEEVIAAAKKQAAQILAEAKREAEAITKAAEQKVENLRKNAVQEAEAQVSEQKTREIAAVELEVKKMLLTAKKELIDNSFEEAKQQIAKTAAAKRKEHTQKALEKAKKEIEVHRVLCNESDIKFIEGYKIQPTKIIGGVIAENKEGTIRIDYSNDALLQKIKEKAMKNVSDILFKEE